MQALGHQLPPPERLRIGALRLGSGNILARVLDVPADPRTGLQGLLHSHSRNQTRPLPVLRCTIEDRGARRCSYALAMAGFGQWGRTPGDLLRWRHHARRIRRMLGKALGIERVNHAEYLSALYLRLLGSAAAKRRLDEVAIEHNASSKNVLLLAATVMNHRVRWLPDDQEAWRNQESAVFILPAGSTRKRLLRAIAPLTLRKDIEASRLRPGEALTLRFTKPTEFFLDEDPETGQEMKLENAGLLHFLPWTSCTPRSQQP